MRVYKGAQLRLGAFVFLKSSKIFEKTIDKLNNIIYNITAKQRKETSK